MSANAATPQPPIIHTLATIDFWVDALGSYNYYWSQISKDYVITVDVDVTSGNDIDFYILDEENYDLWSSSLSCYAEVIRQNAGSISLSFTVPVSGEWHFLFINDNWLFRKHLEGTITAVAPLASNNLSPIIGGVIITILFIVILACIISYVSKYEKRKQQALQGYQPAYPDTPQYLQTQPIQQTRYCPYCGSPKQMFDAQFCSTCGRSFRGPDLG